MVPRSARPRHRPDRRRLNVDPACANLNGVQQGVGIYELDSNSVETLQIDSLTGVGSTLGVADWSLFALADRYISIDPSFADADQ
jgi:hypothetical protein